MTNSDITQNPSPINNFEHPFTELLSLLKLSNFENLKTGDDFDKQKLTSLKTHTINGLATLIWGLESVGHIFHWQHQATKCSKITQSVLDISLKLLPI